MIWNHPSAFLALVALPVIFFLVARSIRRRNKEVETLFSEEMRARLFVTESRSFSFIKHAFLFLALVAFICVFASPRFGRETEPHKTLGRDVFVLFDVSDSMLAEDVAPNRLTVAKLDVEDLLDAAVGDRIGLIAFAGSSQVEIPLTTDYGFFRELLRKVDTNTVRLGGTAIGDAIRLALKRFGHDPNRKRLILLITDGEDHDSLPLEAAKNAAEMKIPVVTIAIGSPDGAKIPVFNVNGERVGYKMFDGKEALSKPDVETLKEIANISGGRFFYADSRLDLANVYKASVELQERAEIAENVRVVIKDRYQPFLACGLLFFTIYYFFPTHFPRMKRSKTITAALIVVALTPPFSGSEATARENSLNSEQPATLKLSKRQEVKAYNESLKLAQTDKEEFQKKQTELASSANSEVASRANYNLGVARLDSAQKAAKELAVPDETNAVPTMPREDAADDSAPEDARQKAKDAVEEYNKAREMREEKRNIIETTAHDAAQNFFHASQSKKVGKTSREDAEAVSRWTSQLHEQERAREIDLRSKALPDPNDRLRWLKNELDEMIDSVHELGQNAHNADFYRSLNAKKEDTHELTHDVNAVASALCDVVSNPPATTQSVPGVPNSTLQNDMSAQKPDPEGASILVQAKEKFLRHEQEASKQFAQYDANAAKTELRRAETQLAPFHDVPLRYDALVSELVQEERKELQFIENSAQNPPDAKRFEDYRWSRQSLTLSIDELMRKARNIVADKPLLEKGAPPQAETTSEDKRSLEDSFDDETGEPTFDSNEVDATTPPQPKTYEERALESSMIALKYETELADAVKKAGEMSDGNFESLDNTQELVSAQRKIAEILQEIARPFQDENQQNQNQNQNQNQQNSDSQNQEQNDREQKEQKNQDSQNQDSNNKQNSENDDVPDELDKPNQSEPEDSKEEEKKNASKQQETTVETEDSKSSKEKNASKQEKTEEQKEAEELTRRVMRRQKDAEPQRNAVRQALKKREKSGKDW